MSMTAASSPTRGPTTTRGSFTACRSRIACRVLAGSFPTGSMVASLSGEQLEQVRRQVEELRAAAGTADVAAQALAEADVGRLAEQRLDLSLGLRADAGVRQPRRHRVGTLDAAGRRIDLVREIEAVHVVVH